MLEERLEDIREELGAFDDEFMKYSFLVELSAYVNPGQEGLMDEEHVFRGCQSQVWLDFSQDRDGAFHMRAMSDTLIIRGVLYVMMELLNGVPVEEIAASGFDFLEACGIKDQFSDQRVTGIGSIMGAARDWCRAQL